ncbi:amino acid transporter [Stylonychia lemnae]|uniref:Amino acid transporter n=1 Tax=Stylonychia lemnae TaxID=5949 RepID=A0A078AEV7_STYLE|nr:amino acid transporter [Stylonychia lemnae]|eukprot:CDW80760.1 amino acid transporter [Stylonychia lemnae]
MEIIDAASQNSTRTSKKSQGTGSGYKQELNRGFSAFMSFSITFTNVACISSIVMLIDFGMITGGPVVMLFGWILVSIFTMIVASSMAEICSTYPVTGSVYYWSGALANYKWSPIASYLCGWFNFLGNLANNASFSFGLAKFLSGIFALSIESKDAFSVHTQIFIAIVLLILWSLKNYMKIEHQGWFNNTSAVYQFVSTIFVVIVIFLVSPKFSSNKFVFTKFNNQTGFDNTYYVSMLGLLMAMFGFSGYEGGATLAEETTDASVSAPKGIIYSCLLSAITGLIFIMAILYGCGENIDSIINGNSDHGAVNFFYIVFSGDQSWVVFMILILMMNLFLVGFSTTTISSRVGYAMARDGAFPYSKFLSQVNPQTQTPDRMIFLSYSFQIFLLKKSLQFR